VLEFVVAEACRDLGRAGRLAVFAVLLIALSLGALGAFWVLSENLGAAVARWRERLLVVVYLRGEPSAPAAAALITRVEALQGVKRARYVSKAEALRVMRETLGEYAAVTDSLPSNPLPASIEVTPDATVATLAATHGLVERLASLPEAEEVQGGTVWVERLAHWQRLLRLLGLAIGALLAAAAVFTITTATTLVLHARREEIEIMRLVGAPERLIQLPLLLQGIVQGVVGAGLSILALGLAYHLVRPALEPLLTLTLGLPRTTFLSPEAIATLLVGGGLLGGAGGWLARGRYA
jgi:cell division transport system permease protein